MLDINFFTTENTMVCYELTEKAYERLAKSGFGKVTAFSVEELCVEGEEDKYEVAKLEIENRNIYIKFLEDERHLELKKLFGEMDNCPTIKEIRDNFNYVKLLTELIDLFRDERNIYLWLG
jgi:hypothetical protein